jgi:tape measure domain-containing protein
MADVDISLEIEAKKAKKNLDKINKELKDTGKNAKKVAALGAGLSFAIGEAIKIENLETQFIAFTGSAEAAAEQVERIAAFSAATPFQLEDLANANRTLLAFGSTTEDSLKQLKQLGEAAAATGNNVGDLATIFGQIQVEGRLTSERFNQLAERGINLGPALAEGLGVAESQLKSLRAQGKIFDNWLRAVCWLNAKAITNP